MSITIISPLIYITKSTQTYKLGTILIFFKKLKFNPGFSTRTRITRANPGWTRPRPRPGNFPGPGINLAIRGRGRGEGSPDPAPGIANPRHHQWESGSIYGFRGTYTLSPPIPSSTRLEKLCQLWCISGVKKVETDIVAFGCSLDMHQCAETFVASMLVN